MPKETDFLVIEEFKRTKFPVLICLFGFSGCGKTKSAIKIAKGLGGKTMFLDTETGRGRVYAKDAPGFGYTEMTPPFTPERYIAAIRQIEAAGYDNLVIDSGSHEWDGLGGMLEIAESNVTASGRKITGLGKWSVKSRHKTFMNSMMAGRMNIIICLRAKDKYVQSGAGDNGKITMDGFVPLQERNFKYDMMIMLPMPEDGEGRFLMDRTKGFKCPGDLLPFFKEGEQITENIGIRISEWIATGDPVDEVLRQLKADALEQAEYGTDHFRKYWATLPREAQSKLKPHAANFESIAVAADKEARDAAEAMQAEHSANPPPLAKPDPGRITNATGVDITGLVGRRTAVKAEPKDELTAAIESPGRSIEDADWWAIIDQIEPTVKGAKSPLELSEILFDNSKTLNSLLMAPNQITAYWKQLIETTQGNFTRKVA